MKKIIAIVFFVLIMIFLLVQFEENNVVFEEKILLTYNEAFEEKLFDIEIEVSPQPNLSSTSEIILSIKPLKRDSNVKIVFTEHPYFEIVSNDKFDFSAKLGEQTSIRTKIHFKTIGASALYVIVGLIDKKTNSIIKEEIVVLYFYVPAETEDQLKYLRKGQIFEEQLQFPRVSKTPTKAYFRVPRIK